MIFGENYHSLATSVVSEDSQSSCQEWPLSILEMNHGASMFETDEEMTKVPTVMVGWDIQ